MKPRVVIAGALLCWAGSMPAAELPASEGEQVFKTWCAPCHGKGPGMPGTSALQVKYKGTIPAALEDRKDLTRVAVKAFVRNGAYTMAPFRKTEISDAQLEALAAYLARKKR